MAEKKRYGLLELDDETKQKLDREVKKKPFFKVLPEIKDMVKEQRRDLPRIIDVHCHPYTKDGWRSLGKFRTYIETYLYGKKNVTAESVTCESPTEEEWVNPYRELGAVCIPTAWAAATTMSPDDPMYHDNTNEFVAGLRNKFPDVVISAWGSVDPWQGEKALKEVENCAKKLNLLGVKFQQVGQAFSITDQKIAYPIWDLCQSLGMPITLHCGYTGLASGAPGGMGLKLKYTMDIIPGVDDVAADFPRLKIIMLHHTEGRDEDAVLVCRHKGNVFREVSGMWPEYYEINVPHMWHEMNRRQQDKYMFGSEYNLFPLDGILYQHLQKSYREGILEKLFWKNAVRILGEDFDRVGINLKEWKQNLEEI